MLNKHINTCLRYQPRLKFLAGIISLLRDQERLDERCRRERNVPHVPVGRADTVEQRRRLGQGAPRQEQGRRRERGGPRPGTQTKPSTKSAQGFRKARIQ